MVSRRKKLQRSSTVSHVIEGDPKWLFNTVYHTQQKAMRKLRRYGSCAAGNYARNTGEWIEKAWHDANNIEMVGQSNDKPGMLCGRVPSIWTLECYGRYAEEFWTSLSCPWMTLSLPVEHEFHPSS